MPTPIWIALGAIALVLVTTWSWRAGGIERAVARAVSKGDVDALLELLLKRTIVTQPAAFNHVIRRLWNDYQRPLAAPLIRALGERHSDVPISQYWISQLQTVEPGLAKEHLDPTFLQDHFRPQVAAGCGTAG